MANINILSLPVQTAVSGSEYMPIVSGLANNAVTRRVQLGLISGFTAGTSPQAANNFYSGPAVPGPAAIPTFRLMVTADLPQGGSGTLISGGGAVNSILTLQSTAGVGSADAITFQTGATQTERARIDTSGNVLIGLTTGFTIAGITPNIQLHAANNTSIISAFRWSNDGAAPSFYGVKSRGGAIGTRGAVALNDSLTSFFGYGDDGTAFQTAGNLRIVVDGSVSAGIVPGRFEFYTANASGVATLAMRIDSGQRVGIGVAPTIAVLQQLGSVGGNTCAVFGTGQLGVSLVQNEATVGLNSYFNTAWLSLATGFGAVVGCDQGSGAIKFQTAASVTGTGTAQTMTQRLLVEQSGRVTMAPIVAIPAGGTAHLGYCFSSTADFGVFFGSGAPTLSAAQGSLYLRSDGIPSINTSGSTTWSEIATEALIFRVPGVNFNSANTDTSVAIVLPPGYTRYSVPNIRISHASATLTTATCGLFTASGGGGTAILSGVALTVNTASENTNNNMQIIGPANSSTQSFNVTPLFFRIQTAEGSAATADVTIHINPLP